MTDLKSAILFFHLVGLVFGLGGAWTIDLFLLNYLTRLKVTSDVVRMIEFLSKLVTFGLALLWVSGLGFIVFYMAFTPENLSNEKVWAKVSIVLVLSLNGLLVHRAVLPVLRTCIGSPILLVISRKTAYNLATVASISFVSWFYPICLGVSKSLNFSVPGVYIFASYLMVIACALFVAHLTVFLVFKRLGEPHPAELVRRLIRSGVRSSDEVQRQLKLLTGRMFKHSDIVQMVRHPRSQLHRPEAEQKAALRVKANPVY